MTDPERGGAAGDGRMFSSATARNREPIFALLQRLLPASGTVLEIASGTGEHAACFAPRLGHLTWQPSDVDAAALASIEAWRAQTQADNFRPALRLDIAEPESAAPALPGDLQVIFSCNMIHISPWACCRGLMALAGRTLPAGGLLILYGPFKRDGRHTAPSNADFDQWLKSQDPAWGVRDLADVAACAADQGLALSETVDMPANNLSLVFARTADQIP